MATWKEIQAQHHVEVYLPDGTIVMAKAQIHGNRLEAFVSIPSGMVGAVVSVLYQGADAVLSSGCELTGGQIGVNLVFKDDSA